MAAAAAAAAAATATAAVALPQGCSTRKQAKRTGANRDNASDRSIAPHPLRVCADAVPGARYEWAAVVVVAASTDETLTISYTTLVSLSCDTQEIAHTLGPSFLPDFVDSFQERKR